MRKFVQMSLLSLSFAVSAQASTTILFSQTNAFSGLATGSQTLSFNLAETARGSSVQLSDIVSVSITGIIDKAAGSYTVTHAGIGQIFIDVKRQTSGWFTSAKPIGFAGSSGSPNLFANLNRTEGISFGSRNGDYGTSSTGALGGFLATSSFDQFLGAGTFDIEVNAAQLDTTTRTFFGSTVYRVNSEPALSGNVVVTYEIVPEPSVASLLVVGMAGAIALRRLRRKAD